jgi:hypothetical protein
LADEHAICGELGIIMSSVVIEHLPVNVMQNIHGCAKMLYCSYIITSQMIEADKEIADQKGYTS